MLAAQLENFGRTLNMILACFAFIIHASKIKLNFFL